MDYSNMSNEELNRLVEGKDGGAICEQAERFLYGTKGCTKNISRAYQMFHKGEKCGLPQAYLGLAYMYENGIYFMKNLDIANEYREKARQAPRDGYVLSDANMVQENKNTQNIDTQQMFLQQEQGGDIRGKITQAELARQKGDYLRAKALCDEALNVLDCIANGMISYCGTEDLDCLRIDAYWVLAYTAFNEQQCSEMEKYLSKEGVYALHPWGAYMATVLHKNMQSPQIVLEQDLQMLLNISQNLNLSTVEKGDVIYMIAELILEGYGSQQGYTLDHAYDYFNQAGSYGNACAGEQIAKFQKNMTGELIYKG